MWYGRRKEWSKCRDIAENLRETEPPFLKRGAVQYVGLKKGGYAPPNVVPQKEALPLQNAL